MEEPISMLPVVLLPDVTAVTAAGMDAPSFDASSVPPQHPDIPPESPAEVSQHLEAAALGSLQPSPLAHPALPPSSPALYRPLAVPVAAESSDSSDVSDSDVEVLEALSSLTGQKRKRDVILVSSDSENSDGEDGRALDALVQSRAARRRPSTPSSPTRASEAAMQGPHADLLERLARKREMKKARRMLKKTLRAKLQTALQHRAVLLQRQRSRSEERGPKPQSGAGGGVGFKRGKAPTTPRAVHHGLQVQTLDGRPFPSSLLDPTLEGVGHVVMLDLDNVSFFTRLSRALSAEVLICAFVGGHSLVRVPNDSIDHLVHQHHPPPISVSSAASASSASSSSSSASSASSAVSSPSPSPSLSPFAELVSQRRLVLTWSGTTANASDFAMAVKCGQLHATLPLHIPITIFSGDKGLDEVLRHLPGRRCQRVDPHAQHREEDLSMEDTAQLIWMTLQSITER